MRHRSVHRVHWLTPSLSKIKLSGNELRQSSTYAFFCLIDEGTKRLKVAYVSDTVLVLCVISVDEENGVETPCGVILAGMYEIVIYTL